MKLAIDCRMLGSGGIGTYLQSLLPFFIKNYECTLILKSKDLDTYKNISNLNILICDISTFSLKELFFFPKQFLNQINYCDIYYSPYCNIPKGIKVPVFTTIHDVVFLDVPGLTGKAGLITRKWFYQRAYNKSKVVFTVSNFSKERIEYHLNTKKVQTIVTYNAIPQWFSENVDKNRQKEDFILFVGNIKRHKGLHTLLPAFQKAMQKGFNCKLKIVGNADNFRSQDNTIWNEIKKLPEDSVEFTGRISDEELKHLYSSAKLLIQPSLYEGFGMPPMEALISGTNVVISDIPVFKEIYKDFPVTYFNVSDSEDLCNKMIETINLPPPSNLPERFSFEKTYNIIYKTLTEYVH